MAFDNFTTSEEIKNALKKKDKVAIIGFAESWNKAPFHDDEFEIWGLNSLFEIIPPVWDAWFEIHERKSFKLDSNKEIGYGLTRTGQPYIEALKELKGRKGSETPILMVNKYDDMPNSIKYPIDEIVSKFGNYFNNSISYEIALAIDWGYQEIHVYGVDMATQGPAQGYGGEYSHQRPSCEWMLGIAQGRGIKVYIPPSSDLLKTRYLYGFEDEKIDNFENKVNSLITGMNQRFTGAQQQFELTRINMNQIDGRLEEVRLISEKNGTDEAMKKWIEDEKRYLNESRLKEIQAFEMARKQMDQYIGATECAKEIIKIWK